MDSGIALTVAEGGFTTIIREPTQESMDKGLERVRSFLAKGVEKGKAKQLCRVGAPKSKLC